MKIKTRLQIAAWAPAAMVVVMTAALLWGFQAIQVANERERTIRQVLSGMHELNSLLAEYFFYHEERPRQQFLAEHESITARLASLQVSGTEQTQCLEEIRGNVASTKETFSKLLANYEKLGQQPHDPELQRVEERLAGQLLVRSRQAVADGERLQALVSADEVRTQNRIGWLVLLLATATTLPVTVVLFHMTRRISDSLSRLLSGIETVGGGDLAHRVGLDDTDEIGTVAAAFDRMTAQIEATTVSRDRLSESESFYRQTLESIPGIVFTGNSDGVIDYVSPHLMRLTGASQEEILGEGWSLLLHPDDREATLAAWRKAVDEGVPCDVEYRVRLRDGHYEWFRVRARPIRDAANRIARWMGVATNIDASRRAQEDLRRTADELARSNRELEQFAYVCAHDLQEPLRQVRSFVQLLGERHGEQFEGQAADYFAYIYDGAARMTDLVTGLLALSRVGSREVRHEPTSCQAALDRALANLQEAIAQSHASITHDEMPTVAAEPTQLAQLFQNLVGNAIKFKREGVPPRIHVHVEPEEGAWRFSVQDNGIGVDRDYCDKVFVIFQRLHPRDQYPGTGIGLTICKKIVEQHGGRIWIDTSAKEGSRFVFTLPDRECREDRPLEHATESWRGLEVGSSRKATPTASPGPSGPGAMK